MAIDPDTAVVHESTVLDEAYAMGYDEFSGVEVEQFDLEGFHGTARWDSHLLPRLRALSGYGDRGHGTYTEDREVVVIPVGNEDDHPAEAHSMNATHVLNAAVEQFTHGAHDAAENEERGERNDGRIC